MKTSEPAVPIPPFVPSSLPSLKEGDRLTREEFERRFEAMPHLKKAELLEGVVHMPSPVRWKNHGRANGHVVGWLIQYEAKTPGVQMGDNSTIRLSMDSEPQPDASMIIDPSRGGQAQFSPDDYLEGSPELVAEIAASSSSMDLNTKFRLYKRNNVREYIVWRVKDQALDWFSLEENEFIRHAPNVLGILQSKVFPGLWLDPRAMTQFDIAKVLEVLHQGLASPEHEDFVRQLQSAGPRIP